MRAKGRLRTDVPAARPIATPAFRGELYLPGRPAAPLGAMVILNSSAGVCDIRERFYARFLAVSGLAALVVDSFGPRDIVETTADQSRLLDRDMERDAYAAQAFLAADPTIDPGRIAVMGVSKGGLAALHTGLLARRAWFGRPDHDFAARIALVPPAHMQQRDARTDGRPLLVLLAGLDDCTGTAAPRRYAARLRAAGRSEIAVTVYPGALHAWERTGPPLWLGSAENYSRCNLLVEDDGGLTDPVDGRRMSMREFFRDRDRYRFWGGHAGGGTEAFKRRAAADIVRFLADQAGWDIPNHP